MAYSLPLSQSVKSNLQYVRRLSVLYSFMITFLYVCVSYVMFFFKFMCICVLSFYFFCTLLYYPSGAIIGE